MMVTVSQGSCRRMRTAPAPRSVASGRQEPVKRPTGWDGHRFALQRKRQRRATRLAARPSWVLPGVWGWRRRGDRGPVAFRPRLL